MPLAVQTDHLSKHFYLRHNRVGSIKERFIALFDPARREVLEEFWALRDVSLDIAAGDSVGLIGSNGSGKSTLLKLIAGIHRPTSGAVRLAAGSRVGTMIELGVGFHPELNGRENIFLNASVYGLSFEAIQQMYPAIVAYSGLEQFIDQPLKNYSSGMQVRLGFSVSIHLEPDIMLLDEIFAVGDADFQQRCMRTMREFQERGRTILFVSHSSAAVRAICRTACLLDRGRLRFHGAVDGAFRAYDALRGATAPQALAVPDAPAAGAQPSASGEPWHRTASGGRWAEVGALQRDFMIGEGLRPEHYLLDVGCGALRGGVEFIRYLHPGHYYGVDASGELIRAGLDQELAGAALDPSQAHFIVNGGFVFGETPQFDVALAQELFPVLPLNGVLKCIAAVMQALRPGGAFYASCYEVVDAAMMEPLVHPSGVITYPDRAPFHYSVSMLTAAARVLGVGVERMGPWGHPLGLVMLRMTHASRPDRPRVTG